MKTIYLSDYLEPFFLVRLSNQKKCSVNTIQSYSTALQLLIDFAGRKLKKKPFQLLLEDITAQMVSDFLDYLEEKRNASIRTRNIRMAAIKSFFSYLNAILPEYSGLIRQVLAIPYKRAIRKLIAFLSDEEASALLATPDQNTALGKRDYTLILTLIQTGCRLRELIELKWGNIRLGEGGCIDFMGKGRKERRIPISKQLNRALQLWSKEIDSMSSDIVFPTIHGTRMSPDVIQYLIKKHVKLAIKKCPSLGEKTISPHVFRHTAAMRMLARGIDIHSIALWLGHETPETTYIYLSMDIPRLEKILKKMPMIKTKMLRYKATDPVIKFLKEIIEKME